MDDSASDLDFIFQKEMIFRAYRLRFITITILFSSSIVFVVLFLFGLRMTFHREYNSNVYEDVIKKTRVVHAIAVEPSYKYESEQSLIKKHISPKLLDLLNPSHVKDEDPEEHYYDGDEIVADDNDNDDDYDDAFDNAEFSEGDFDYSSNSTSKETFKIPNHPKFKNSRQVFRIKFVKPFNEKNNVVTPIHRSHSRVLRNVSLISTDGIPIVEDKIFWSQELEEIAPKGITDEQMQITLRDLRRLHAVKAESPTWDRCGRPKNLFVVFENSFKACARYRAPHEYLVQGEVLSFYLSRMLGIHNVPVVALVNSNDSRTWSRHNVKSVLRRSQWETNTTVALIQWIDNLERDKMPVLLRSALMNRTTISGLDFNLLKLPVKNLIELLQWSDLILFDYVTGNYDRVASMQDAADKEQKISILNETIHNLVRSKSTGGLWLIDNESGLLDSYSLLYSRPGEDGRFLNFHRQMLNTMCLFRRTTIEHLKKLYWSGRAAEILLKYVKVNEPLFPSLKDTNLLIKKMQERIGEVYNHIKKCMII